MKMVKTMVKKKPMIDKNWRKDGLYLTSGGRIVKPGFGESANEPYDKLLMTADELQQGIKLEEFQKRLKVAIERRNRCPHCGQTLKNQKR